MTFSMLLVSCLTLFFSSLLVGFIFGRLLKLFDDIFK